MRRASFLLLSVNLVAMAIAVGPPMVIAQGEPSGHGAGNGFDSGNLTLNMTWTHEFSTAGSFDYVCHLHHFMMGSIVVTSTNATALSGVVDVTIRDFSFQPANLTIRPGTTVRWTNADVVPHTVSQVVQPAAPGLFDLFGLPWWQVGLFVGVLLLCVLLFFFFKTRRQEKGKNEMSYREQLRDAWRRATPFWTPIVFLLGLIVTYYITTSDDPCCHVQTPGLGFSAYGGISLWLFHRRRRRYETLALEGFNTHNFRDVEEELEELSKKLPFDYRRRFLAARAEFRGGHGKSGRARSARE